MVVILCGEKLRIKYIYTGWIVNVISTKVQIKKLIHSGKIVLLIEIEFAESKSN